MVFLLLTNNFCFNTFTPPQSEFLSKIAGERGFSFAEHKLLPDPMVGIFHCFFKKFGCNCAGNLASGGQIITK
jgi:hypothetical protein